MGMSLIILFLLFEEVKYLVYVFCDGVDLIWFNYRYKESFLRLYCVCCRYVYKGFFYSEGFEKYFMMKFRF